MMWAVYVLVLSGYGATSQILSFNNEQEANESAIAIKKLAPGATSTVVFQLPLNWNGVNWCLYIIVLHSYGVTSQIMYFEKEEDARTVAAIIGSIAPGATRTAIFSAHVEYHPPPQV